MQLKNRTERTSTHFLCRNWAHHEAEHSFVTRTLAGAASRSSRVTIFTPEQAGAPTPDGAFDVLGIGEAADGSWPPASLATWPSAESGGCLFVVDKVDPSVRALIEGHVSDPIVFTVDSGRDPYLTPSTIPLNFVDCLAEMGADFIGLHVPVNPLAEVHRHSGLGFSDYLLVLSDRSAADEVVPPTPLVAWLTARFPTADIVVLEDANAAAWRGRALRGVVTVDSRTDLWRLLAHAQMVIDLAPGPLIARECIESLRFAVPIVVPVNTPAAVHAGAGGGLTFSGIPSLIACVEQLLDGSERSLFASNGKFYADTTYGDAGRFVERVARVMYSNAV